MNELIKGLNDKQREAVVTTQGPLLILAGAGSGKTRVLTTRIAHILNEGLCERWEVLAFTFTNKAAAEMKTRVEKILKDDVSSMWIGTFHSICVRILRREISALGYTNNFTIYDRADQQSLIKEILKEKGIGTKDFPISACLNAISEAKNLGEGKEYLDDIYGYHPIYKIFGEVYEEYERKKKLYNSLDFDDLILKTLVLFRENEDIRSKYERKFKYVFVDEYQDTNKPQYELIKYFSKGYGNICAVGDADQSIYGWRGADISNILNFEKDFKEAKIILLEQNYRSTKNILHVANKVIKNNFERKDKNLWTDNESGERVLYKELDSDSEEAVEVTNTIEHLKYKGYKFEDMAILYRTNAQSRAFEEALMREGINYRVVGGLKFYDRREIKDLIAYLKIFVNPDDDVALKRIINLPRRGIGDTTLDKLSNLALSRNTSIYRIISETAIDGITGRTKSKLLEFTYMMENTKKAMEDMSVTDFVNHVLDRSGYLKMLEDSKLREDKTRIENLSAFISSITDYEASADNPSLEDYLATVTLLSDVDKTDDSSTGVSLMTIHAAKGLEYKVVFLTGLEEGLFPSERSIEEDRLEEERRLCYVALTRAEEKLYLTSCSSRRVFGKYVMHKPSRFIEEMGDALEEEKSASYQYTDNFRESFASSAETMAKDLRESFKKPVSNKKTLEGIQLQIGNKVKHKIFGVGTIVSITEKNDGDELIITFDNKGIKRLNKNLAPLELLNG
ncbi:UvrD-helicase domain-containing protein [Lagierella sp.]|uniref:ATP-dependent helicase n=1 Tax=Lagierella sp. TaxID=2849657 RepID=UPI00260219F8|nr:UvrD-helicase domain-containing protein [Lagierella sp.]